MKPTAPKALRVGLTGSIGSGKSTVARLLRDHGIPVLDADAVARAVSAQTDVLRAVSASFGPEFVLEGGLNRAKLAERIFQDPTARASLNAIIHPRVRSQMQAQQDALELAGASLVVQDIPLLFENGLESLFDLTVLVDAPLELRIARVMARDGVSEAQVRARDATQMPASQKRQQATFVLENDRDPAWLEAQVLRLLERLRLEVRSKSKGQRSK